MQATFYNFLTTPVTLVIILNSYISMLFFKTFS